MRRTRLQLSGDCWVEMKMTLLRFEPRLRRGRSFEGCPDMVGADEDEGYRRQATGVLRGQLRLSQRGRLGQPPLPSVRLGGRKGRPTFVLKIE